MNKKRYQKLKIEGKLKSHKEYNKKWNKEHPDKCKEYNKSRRYINKFKTFIKKIERPKVSYKAIRKYQKEFVQECIDRYSSIYLSSTLSPLPSAPSSGETK